MCEQSRVFNDGDIVWVKLSYCWWPGEVHGDDRLPADMVTAFKKKRPHAIVKFFQEDSYEYVRNLNNVHGYRCDRRLDFIRKGLDLYQANHKYMEMFPADVATAERRTKGNPDIINDPAVLNPVKQTSASKRWAEIVGEAPKKVSASGSPITPTAASTTPNKRTASSSLGTPKGPNTKILISSPSNTPSARPAKEHEVRILSSATTTRSPATIGSGGGGAGPSTPTSHPQPQLYKCHLCAFSSGRMNLLILHSKSHSSAASSTTYGGDASLDSRRNSLTNRSTTTTTTTSSSSLTTPTKRSFSTTSSGGSSCSPALSPVGSPKLTATVVVEKETSGRSTRRTSTAAVASNKTRPPKKRTKRMSSSADERLSPAREQAAATRRGRCRRQAKDVDEGEEPLQAEKEEAVAAEKVAEESPKIVLPPTNNRNVKSLLKDWSDDEDDEDDDEQESMASLRKKAPSPEIVTPQKQIAIPPPPTTPTTTVHSPATTSSPACPTTDGSGGSGGRSSPIRCRNIPKKDRREIVIEEFEPKVSPHRTTAEEELPVAVAVEAIDAPQPIVQKKKKAAIERLSQQVSSPVEDHEEKKLIATAEVEEAVAEKSKAESVQKKNGGGKSEAVNEGGDEDTKIKCDELERKDEDLLAQIGSILSDTSGFAERGIVSAESVSPLKAKLSDLSLPPKERGKRIFKSRNTSLGIASGLDEEDLVLVVPGTEKKEEEAAGKELQEKVDGEIKMSPVEEQEKESEAVAQPQEQGTEEVSLCAVEDAEGATTGIGEEEKEQDKTKTADQEPRNEEESQITAKEMDEPGVKAESVSMQEEDKVEEQDKGEDPAVIAPPPVLPRKRRFDNDEESVELQTLPPVAAEEVEKSPESKVRRVSVELFPESGNQESKEADDNKVAVVVVGGDEGEEEQQKDNEGMEMEVAEEVKERPQQPNKEVEVKPKISDRTSTKREENEAENNGDADKSLSAAESSPIKTNDLLKAVQKVQIVQRVRAQDGSEMTETKVAKISSTDSSVLAVAITQAASVTASTAVAAIEDGTTLTAVNADGDEKASVNGTAAHLQESPARTTPESSASPETTGGGAAAADPQILAIPAETFDGPANSFYLCTVDDGNFIPIDNQPLYLDASNQLVPTPPAMQTVVVMEGDGGVEGVEEAGDGGEGEHPLEGEDGEMVEDEGEVLPQIVIGPDEHVVDLTDTDAKYILNTGMGQQILLDLQSLLTIASGGEAPRLVCDGQEMVIEGTPQEILSSITLSTSTNVDLELEEQQTTHDIIAAALTEAPSIVYPNVSAAYVSETNAVLTQPPIMSTLEVPSKADTLEGCATAAAVVGGGAAAAAGAVGASTNLEESLAVIGVKKEAKMIPASLELPITITNPKIVAKTTQASIRSVYMTTTAVCASKMETEADELWTTADTPKANGHEVVQGQENMEMVVGEREGKDGDVAIVQQEEERDMEGIVEVGRQFADEGVVEEASIEAAELSA